jgi:hypothetical protein
MAKVKGMSKAVPIVEFRPGTAPKITPRRTPLQMQRRVKGFITFWIAPTQRSQIMTALFNKRDD